MRRRMVMVNAVVSAVVVGGALVGGVARADVDPGPTRVSGPSPFRPGCTGESGPGTLHPNAEVQPDLAVDPRDPRHLVGTFQADRFSDVASQGLLGVTSFDGGHSWSRAALPFSVCAGGEFTRATDSSAAISPDGTAYLAGLSLNGGIFSPGGEAAVLVARSGDGGRTWAKPTTLIREATPAFNDFPLITADPNNSRYVYVAWVRIALLAGDHFEGPTYLARSTDGGRTWQPPRSIYDPGVDNQTIANKILVLPDGTLVNCFSTFHQDPVTGQTSVNMSVIRSTDMGVTWSEPTKVSDIRSVGATDPDTGTPTRDGATIPHFAVGARGYLYAAWQDSRFTAGARDAIALSRSTDGGLTWSDPVPVNHDLSVAAFSPALAAGADGTVGVTYYDFRSNTPDPTTLPTDYWLATSRNATSWSDRHVAGPFDLATAPRADRPVAGSRYLGDHHGLVAAGPFFIPLFPATTGNPTNPTDIFTALLAAG
ncbi:MAG: hypothetical protein QOI74_316 [Micromonosporaceae bacterium]|nr:hypothetical protein [Micromonosporaceae bacterium]